MAQDESLTLRIGEKGAEEAGKKLDNLRGKLADTGKQTSTLGENFNKAAVAFTAVGVGLTAYSKHATDATIDYVKNINSISRITGDTVETTSRLQYVFQRSGVAADQTSQVFGVFAKQITATNEAAKDGALKQQELNNKIDAAKIKISALTGEQKKNGDSSGAIANQIQALNIQVATYSKQLNEAQTPLEKLHINTKNADGSSRSFNDILLDVADRFKTMPNGAEKTATALDLFGRSGKNLIPILSKGRDGIEELEKQADKLGFTLTSKNVEAVSKYVAAQKTLKDAQQQFTLAVGTAALPMWQKLADAQVYATKTLQGLPGPLKGATADVIAFGGPVASGAGALAGFAGNLSSAAPILSKLPALLNPTTLAFTGAAVGIGALVAGGIALYKHFKKQNEQLPVVSKYTHDYGAEVTFLKLAQDKQSDAEKDVAEAVRMHQAALDAIKPAQDVAKQKADAVTAAQQLVTNAFNQYGQNSPQYAAATQDLANKTNELNLQLLNNWSNAVNVKTAEDNLNTTRSSLAKSTQELSRLQDILNTGLDNSVNKIAQFGPTAISQVGAVATLQGSIDKVVSTFNNFNGSLQSQISNQGALLQGLGSNIDRVQGQSAKLNKSLQNASGLQVAGGRGLQGFASGGYTGRGGENDVAGIVHRGEYVVPRDQVNQTTGQPFDSGNATVMAQPATSVNISIGTMVGGDDASMRTLAVQMAQLVQDALKGQGVNDVNQLRVAG